MNLRYLRNRLYLNEYEQEKIRHTPLLLAGSGLGSNIAECALRFGFENITVVDGDIVEDSNLNRQNYTEGDIGHSKAKSLYKRLKSINSKANIRYYAEFITAENIDAFIEGQQVAVNALDFASDLPLLFDKKCQENGIPVLHPYNLGWAGLVTVINPNGLGLQTLSCDDKVNELSVVDYVCMNAHSRSEPCEWLEEIIKNYKMEEELLPPPQLSIASWIVGGMCTHIIYKIVTNHKYKEFPEFDISMVSF